MMEETLDLREILQIIYKKLWFIILITLVCVISSGIISFFVLDKVYEASTTLMVSKTREDQSSNLQYNDILMNQKLVKTYSEIVKSNRVLEKVIEQLGLNMTTADLRNSIQVQSVSDTEIIRISVQDKDPNFATELANSIAVVFMGEIGSIMKMDNVQFIDPAKVPVNPIKPRPLFNVAIAAVLGMMISVFIVFLVEYFDNTIKSIDDIENKLGLPVLGSIPAFDE
ncbi:MAG: Wzz/FepE/Etk N-terminal domain-containing protein [Caldicoprobacterales bacterium]|nr:capsular biosynthesis protein [Clostridiales bacterium]